MGKKQQAVATKSSSTSTRGSASTSTATTAGASAPVAGSIWSSVPVAQGTRNKFTPNGTARMINKGEYRPPTTPHRSCQNITDEELEEALQQWRSEASRGASNSSGSFFWSNFPGKSTADKLDALEKKMRNFLATDVGSLGTEFPLFRDRNSSQRHLRQRGPLYRLVEELSFFKVSHWSRVRRSSPYQDPHLLQYRSKDDPEVMKVLPSPAVKKLMSVVSAKLCAVVLSQLANHSYEGQNSGPGPGADIINGCTSVFEEIISFDGASLESIAFSLGFILETPRMWKGQISDFDSTYGNHAQPRSFDNFHRLLSLWYNFTSADLWDRCDFSKWKTFDMVQPRHSPLLFIKNLRALLAVFPSLTLPLDVCKKLATDADRSKQLTLPLTCDTQWFGHWTHKGVRHRCTSPTPQLFQQTLWESLLNKPRWVLKQIASTVEGECFLLKIVSVVLAKITHYRFPGFYFPLRFAKCDSQPSFDERRANRASQLYREVLLCCKILDFLGPRCFIGHDYSPLQNLDGSYPIPAWIPISKKTHRSRSFFCFYHGKDTKSEKCSKNISLQESKERYQMLITRTADHILEVKKSTGHWSSKDMKSSNWGRAMVYSAMRHTVSVERAILHHYFKLNRSTALARRGTQQQQQQQKKTSYICHLGLLSYDPITVVFDYLFAGSEYGYPTGFFQKMLGGDDTDDTKHNNKKSRSGRSTGESRKKKGSAILGSGKFLLCDICHFRGHLNYQCPNKERTVCSRCRQRRHNGQKCRDKEPMTLKEMKANRDRASKKDRRLEKKALVKRWKEEKQDRHSGKKIRPPPKKHQDPAAVTTTRDASISRNRKVTNNNKDVLSRPERRKVVQKQPIATNVVPVPTLTSSTDFPDLSSL